MSSPISTILADLRRTVNILRSAVYAIDVRDDIADAIDDSADAIEQIYSDVDSASLRENAFAAALQEAIDDNLLPIPATVIDDNSLPGSKIQNASIPLSKLAEPVQITVDSALSDSSTNPVQNKVIKGAIDELNGSLEDLENSVGLSDAFKEALLNCFEHVAWIDGNGETYYNELVSVFYSPKEINGASLSWTSGYVDNSGRIAPGGGAITSELISGINKYSHIAFTAVGATQVRLAFFRNDETLISRKTDGGESDFPDGTYYVRVTALGITTSDVSNATIRLS